MDESLLGRIVHSEAEAYKLYCEYGVDVGFSVRKGKQTYFIGSKNIRTKEYYCSKQGFKLDDDRVNEASFSKLETRTGCKAMIRFTVDQQGQWVVTRFLDEHNHELASLEDRHLLRSAQSILKSKTCLLESKLNAEISTVQDCSYRAKESGSSENLGSMKTFFYNSIQKMMPLTTDDFQSLFRYFKDKSIEECGTFYWDVQLDDEGRVTNFFWRDSRSSIDYDCFGDVIVLDTTYKTSRYNLICAPFICVNHHWQNVICGCTLLSNETFASFEWMLNTFLESMGGKAPKTIITNPDQAMAEAIEKVFPKTRHRLCLSYITKHAPSHLGELNHNQEFHQLFNKCMRQCDSEEEFEKTWTTMTKEYNTENNEWLNNLYKIREKWCTALNNDTFDGGIKSSERKENANSVLNGIANKFTSLAHFVITFEKMIKRCRRNEANEDYRNSQSAPAIAIKHSNILRHAATVYTHEIYKLFEIEYLDGVGATNFQETSCNNNLCRFDLMMQGRDETCKVVTLDLSTMEVNCTCKKFETMGILCSHALVALHLKNITVIPDRYILKRWSKDAKIMVYSYIGRESLSMNAQEGERDYRKQAVRYAYDLVTMSQEDEGAQKIVWRAFDKISEELHKCLKELTLQGHTMVKNNETTVEDIGGLTVDNSCASLEGVPNEQLKGHVEKRRKKCSGEKRGETSASE